MSSGSRYSDPAWRAVEQDRQLEHGLHILLWPVLTSTSKLRISDGRGDSGCEGSGFGDGGVDGRGWGDSGGGDGDGEGGGHDVDGGFGDGCIA